MWCLQDAMENLIVVYKGDTDVVLDRFCPGRLEAAVWAELVTTSAKGILRDSSGLQVAPGGTDVARGENRFYAYETAGEQQSIQGCTGLHTSAAWSASCRLPKQAQVYQGQLGAFLSVSWLERLA